MIYELILCILSYFPDSFLPWAIFRLLFDLVIIVVLLFNSFLTKLGRYTSILHVLFWLFTPCLFLKMDFVQRLFISFSFVQTLQNKLILIRLLKNLDDFSYFLIFLNFLRAAWVLPFQRQFILLKALILFWGRLRIFGLLIII